MSENLNLNDLESVSGGAGNKFMRYTIKSGDTLWALAKKYGTEVDYLAKINNIKNPDKIKTGDVILVPVK